MKINIPLLGDIKLYLTNNQKKKKNESVHNPRQIEIKVYPRNRIGVTRAGEERKEGKRQSGWKIEIMWYALNYDNAYPRDFWHDKASFTPG